MSEYSQTCKVRGQPYRFGEGRSVCWPAKTHAYSQPQMLQSSQSKTPAHLLGFSWTGPNELVFFTNQGIELYQVNPERRSVKCLKTINVSTNWHIYSVREATAYRLILNHTLALSLSLTHTRARAHPAHTTSALSARKQNLRPFVNTLRQRATSVPF